MAGCWAIKWRSRFRMSIVSQSVRVAIKDHFSELTDPRRREVIYPLLNVVTIAVCAVVCGADDFVAIAAWGRTKQEWLAKFLDLSRGLPSHDRFHALFAAINPASAKPTPPPTSAWSVAPR